MIPSLKKILDFDQATDWAALIAAGAQIVDVRSKGEFLAGHIKHSVNIPLNELDSNLNKLTKDKPVIICCASGMRSASAKSILTASGFEKVYDGGGWMSLQQKIS